MSDILKTTAAALLAAEDGDRSYIGLREAIPTLIEGLLSAMFPRHIGEAVQDTVAERERRLAGARAILWKSLSYVMEDEAAAEVTTDDFIAELPMPGGFESLNAGVAAAVTMYEILRQRGN